jgi:hypothetical protein
VDWLNPRRRRNCQKLIDYIAWHGRKIYLDDIRYFDLATDENMDNFQVDAAVDDLFALGIVEVVMIGDMPCVKLIFDDIDLALVQRPRFALAGKRGVA